MVQKGGGGCNPPVDFRSAKAEQKKKKVLHSPEVALQDDTIFVGNDAI